MIAVVELRLATIPDAEHGLVHVAIWEQPEPSSPGLYCVVSVTLDPHPGELSSPSIIRTRAPLVSGR
jgi:hypothetical protein